MFKVRLAFVVILEVLLLSASLSCKGLSDHKRDNNPVEMKEDNPKTTKNDVAQKVIIRQGVSGGILPLEREWLFYSNGEIRHPNGKITVLTEEQLDVVLAMFQSFASEKMEEVYLAPVGSADHRTLELTLFYTNSTRKIVIEDSNEQVPHVFWDYWDSLQEAAKKSLGNK